MVWTRSNRRMNCGRRRLNNLETLESRALLTQSPASVTHLASLGIPTLATDTATPPAPPTGDTNFDQITGASATRSAYKVDGTGMAVAVIDTGVNYNNVDFGGGGFGPGHKVIAGYDFSTNTPDPMAVTWQHGTAVAGLIAGNSPSDPGIAPGADIVALRVFGNDNTSSFSRVASALQWVVDNHNTYNITVVNISLSDGGNYTQNWYTSGVGGQIASLIQTLDRLNIPVVTAAGNNFNGSQGEGFTAIVPNSLSVTATTVNDTIVSDAQRLGKAVGGDSATVIAAPGQALYAPADGNNFARVDGTSFATPIVSGSVVLLQQIYEQRFGQLPTVAQIEGWLQGGAVTIHDSVTGIDIGRLSITGAAALIPTPAPPPPPPVVVPPPVFVPPPIVTPPTPTPPTPTTTYLFNGQSAGSFQANNANGGWASFFSLFTGRLNSLSGWGKTPQPAPTGKVARSAPLRPATPAAATPDKPSAVVAHHMPRAWDAGFVGRRRHR
jgi:subtilisin family serine protease